MPGHGTKDATYGAAACFVIMRTFRGETNGNHNYHTYHTYQHPDTQR